MKERERKRREREKEKEERKKKKRTWTVEGRLKNIRKIASRLNLNLYAIPVLQSIM